MGAISEPVAEKVKERLRRGTWTQDWMERAECRGVNSFTELHIVEQKRVCRGCKVQFPCLEYGLAGPIGIGPAGEGTVYGGLAPKELAKLQKARAS